MRQSSFPTSDSGDTLARRPIPQGKPVAKKTISRKSPLPEGGDRHSCLCWEGLFEKSPVAAFVYDPAEQAFLLANAAFEHLYGYEAGELSRLSLSALHLDHNGRTPWNGLPEGVSQEIVRHRHKNGRALSVKVSTQGILFNGRPARIAQVLDWTENRELEGRFLRVQRMECLGTLASGVAHDLNNILSPILMAASMLQDDLSPEIRAEFVTAIEQSAQRGASLLRQVLAFVRGVEGEKAVIRPGNLVREVLEMIRKTFPKTIRIHCRLADDLWEIAGEMTKLYQVFLNLAVNARDAMEGQGELTIDVYNCELDVAFLQRNPKVRPGRYIAFTFKDTGCGMSDEVLKQIYVPFFSTKDAEHGTGLGLPTVLGIVKGHGGCIEVKTEVGRGSTFSVFLPAAETAESAETLFDTHGSTGKTILVIDDDEGVRKLVKAILTRHGYRVICASNGTDGVSAYVTKSSAIDLVIADLIMPSMDGVVFSRAIKRLNRHAQIIVSSGMDNAARVEELRALGITRFLRKPYEPATLLEEVRRTLEEEQAFRSGIG